VDLKRNGQAREDYDKHMLVSKLQGFYRGKVARRGIPARRVVYQHRQEKKRREAAAFVVQRPAMQWLAINYVQEVREENRERNALRCTKAGTIQRFWRVVVAIEKRRVLVDIKARAYLKTGLVIQRWYVLRGALVRVIVGFGCTDCGVSLGLLPSFMLASRFLLLTLSSSFNPPSFVTFRFSDSLGTAVSPDALPTIYCCVRRTCKMNGRRLPLLYFRRRREGGYNGDATM
jgi:hypothetical protein